MKNKNGLRYKRISQKSWNIQKKKKKCVFWCKIDSLINETDIISNIDETLFSRSIKK